MPPHICSLLQPILLFHNIIFLAQKISTQLGIVLSYTDYVNRTVWRKNRTAFSRGAIPWISAVRGISSALVSGASGFVGRHLCEVLKGSGARVKALTRNAADGPWDEAVCCELGSGALRQGMLEGVDTVFHLASLAHQLDEVEQDEDIYFRINVEGSREMLEAAVATGVNGFIYLSSVKAMGGGGAELRDEDSPATPEEAYGRSKRSAEELVLKVGARTGMHTVILRPPLVYGPGCGGNLRMLVKSVARGRFPPLSIAENRRSMVDVRDLAQAALLCAQAEKANGRTYLVTDGVGYSTDELVDAIRESLDMSPLSWRLPISLLKPIASLGEVFSLLSGRRAPLDNERLEKLTGSALYNGERLRRELGLIPKYNLPTGIRDMVVDMKERGSL